VRPRSIPRVPDEHPNRIARQPFTFGGVARFAHASLLRLASVALIFGLISGIAGSWLVATCIAPVIDEAVSNLPVTGSIERGALHWPEKEGRLLGANAFASFSVAINEGGAVSAPVDFTFELRTNALVLRSFPGTTVIPYPPKAEIEVNRTALFPAWGAWRAPLLAALIPGSAITLFLSWAILAIVYAVLPFALGATLRRDLNFIGAWKLSVAAQLPGSLMMAFALALYSTGKISAILVFVMLPAHFAPTFCYLLVSPFFLPRAEAAPAKSNPFESEAKRKRKGKNPFAAK
jgi:hypothetical protein